VREVLVEDCCFPIVLKGDDRRQHDLIPMPWFILEIRDNLSGLLHLCVVVAVIGVITRSPKNAIGLREDAVILECAAVNDITWHHANAGVTGSDCSDHKYNTTAGSNSTHCSVIVHGNDPVRLSGVYTCTAGGSNAQAVVIIVGQYSLTISR